MGEKGFERELRSRGAVLSREYLSFFRFGMMVTKMELGGNGDVTELGDVIAPGRFFFSTGRAG